MFQSLKKMMDPGQKILKRAEKQAEAVLALEAQMVALSDEELKEKTTEFKNRLAKGETLDELLVEAFAVVREAAFRVLGLKPYKVQIMGGIALHGGNISEMRTGEGKTLTGTMPAYLNALSGKGVHIITVNEYLASRDAKEMGELFQWLGLTVGLNLAGMTPFEKQQQYRCDIMYSTNNELGFDYLRDHMVANVSDMVQRDLNYAIVDEVDSILIDEARTPLIISGGQKRTANLYRQADWFVKSLKANEDFSVDIKTKNVQLDEEGISKAERAFQIDNLYDVRHAVLLHHINNALKANYIMGRDVDYVVQDGEILIVDQFTGRLMQGRAYSDGLQQAIQAKEGVEIKQETQTLATITFQNFFRLYHKLSGMTGTAKTEEEEFRHIYNMIVVEVPTNRPVARIDAPDLVYKNMKAKFEAVADEVASCHQKGQPVLLGTVAVETSEVISALLKQRGIPHNVLNAKNHEREAEIIRDAGQKGAVTIATNMAGRGTDIKISDEVKALGGLAVIGTERHESRRIDNQLRGRSGRQGDPGYTRFYLSFEDELMRRFGSDRMHSMVEALGMDESQPIESKMVSKAVESAQKRVEGNNYDTRKTLLEYDDVIRRQREVVYEQRQEVLKSKDLTDTILKMFQSALSRFVERHLMSETGEVLLETGVPTPEQLEALVTAANQDYFLLAPLNLETLKGLTVAELKEAVYRHLEELHLHKRHFVTPQGFQSLQKVMSLQVIDTYWMAHIDAMDALRQGIYLRSYGQINPLHEYQSEGYEMFTQLIERIEDEITRYMARAELREEEAEINVELRATGEEDIEVVDVQVALIPEQSLEEAPMASGGESDRS